MGRGVAARNGEILSSGDVWGEDMLLYNDNLRDQTKVRCLSYLSVLSLHILDLFDIVTSFPEARRKLRWAQTRIALMRGMTKLAAAIKAWDRDAPSEFKFVSLSENNRDELVEDILQGGDLTSRPEDHFGLERERLVHFDTTSRNSSRPRGSFRDDPSTTALLDELSTTRSRRFNSRVQTETSEVHPTDTHGSVLK